jgi:dTDP-4-dehydrorhamnose 3,5-epimerase
MKVLSTAIPGVLVVEPAVYRDPRGFFLETFSATRYADAGIPGTFVQDNHSRSSRGVLRGFHFQVARPQGKLVRCVRGAIWDVAADIRRGSPTFARWVGVELTEENHRQLWIPQGFAHAFCVLSEVADVEYKCTEYYVAGDEGGIVWNDPTLAVTWPVTEPTLSAKDAAFGRLTPEREDLPAYVI